MTSHVDLQILKKTIERLIGLGAHAELREALEGALQGLPLTAASNDELVAAMQNGKQNYRDGQPFSNSRSMKAAQRAAWQNGWLTEARRGADMMRAAEDLILNHKEWAHAADCAAGILSLNLPNKILSEKNHHEKIARDLSELQAALEGLGKSKRLSKEGQPFLESALITEAISGKKGTAGAATPGSAG